MNQVRMAGEINSDFLADLLQLLSTRSEATGFLELASGETTGRIWFRKGQMIDARWGIKSGEPAVIHMLGFRQGRFRFVETDTERAPTITRDTTCILLDCMRVIDERAQLPVAEPQAHADPTEPQPVAKPQPVQPQTVAAVEAAPVSVVQNLVAEKPVPQAAAAPIKRPEPKRSSTVRKRRWIEHPRMVFELGLAAVLMVVFSLSVVWPGEARQSSPQPGVASTLTSQSDPDHVVYRAPVPAPPAQGPVRQLWPRFCLSGLLATGANDGEGAAVVNGRVVSVGERVDGMVVREISDRGITVEFQGVRKFQGLKEDNKRSVNRPTTAEIGLSVLREFAFLRNS